MKRRVLSKTTSFHKKKKKEEGQNGVVLNDTVHLPPSPVEQQQKTKTILKKNPSRLSLLVPTPLDHRTGHWPTSRCVIEGAPAPFFPINREENRHREEKKNGQKRGKETKKTEKKQRERLLQNQLPRPPLPAPP